MNFKLSIIDEIIRGINHIMDYQEASEIKLISANKIDETITIWMTSYVPFRNITVTYDLEDGKTESEYRQDITKLIFDRLDKESEDIKKLTDLSEILEEMVENVRFSYEGSEPRLVLELIYNGDKRLTEVFDTIKRTGGVTGRIKNKLKSNDILPSLGKN